MKFRLRNPKHVVVLAVTERKKVGAIYTTYNPEELFQTQTVWIADHGKDCDPEIRVGRKALIQDYFEITTLGSKHFPVDDYVSREDFKELFAYSERSAGKVAACLVHEDSLMGIVE